MISQKVMRHYLTRDPVFFHTEMRNATIIPGQHIFFSDRKDNASLQRLPGGESPHLLPMGNISYLLKYCRSKTMCSVVPHYIIR